MNENQRKRIDQKVSYWDQLKTSLTTPDPVERGNKLSEIADRNEAEEQRKAREAAAKRRGGQGNQT